MPVLNVYQEPDIKTLTTKIAGRVHKNNWAVGDLDKIKPQKAVQAVAPNFIHSIDAAHMHAVMLAAKAEAIEVVGVHDCFGCIAPVGRPSQTDSH